MQNVQSDYKYCNNTLGSIRHANNQARSLPVVWLQEFQQSKQQWPKQGAFLWLFHNVKEAQLID